MSAPISPGARSSVSASRSAATVTSAPAAWAAATRARGRGSPRRRPGTAGAAEVTPPAALASRSTTATSMPSGTARVAITAIVCGSVSASTTYTGIGSCSTGGPASSPRPRPCPRPASRRSRGQPGQVGDHGLEVEQRLEPALADLRLVRRVGGVPGRALQHVAADHRRACGCRSSRGRSSRSGGRLRPAIAAEFGDRLGLGRGRWQREAAVPADRLRDRDVHQLIDRAVADRVEHVGDVIRGRARCGGRRTANPGASCGSSQGEDGLSSSPSVVTPTRESSARFRAAARSRSFCLRGSGEDLPLRRRDR